MSIRVILKNFLSSFPLLDGLFRRYLWSRVHFPEVEMSFLNELPKSEIDVSIDVGAALGAYSWILNRKSNQVYAFEPGKVHSGYLKRAVFLSKITVIRAAVGSYNSEVELYTPGRDNHANHSATISKTNPVINTENSYVEKVNQIVLDDFFSDKFIGNKHIDLIKVDVEGYELEVFKGAQRLLAKYYPLVICEIEARHNPKYSQVFQLLRELGYDCFIYSNGNYIKFEKEEIESLQSDKDLEERMSPSYNLEKNKYINNFVFQHKKSRIRVVDKEK